MRGGAIPGIRGGRVAGGSALLACLAAGQLAFGQAKDREGLFAVLSDWRRAQADQWQELMRWCISTEMTPEATAASANDGVA